MRLIVGMLAVVVLVGLWTARGPGGIDSEGVDASDRAVNDWTVRAQFSQVLPREAIRPIYNPEFTTADRSALQDDELVLGVAIGGEPICMPMWQHLAPCSGGAPRARLLAKENAPSRSAMRIGGVGAGVPFVIDPGRQG